MPPPNHRLVSVSSCGTVASLSPSSFGPRFGRGNSKNPPSIHVVPQNEQANAMPLLFRISSKGNSAGIHPPCRRQVNENKIVLATDETQRTMPQTQAVRRARPALPEDVVIWSKCAVVIPLAGSLKCIELDRLTLEAMKFNRLAFHKRRFREGENVGFARAVSSLLLRHLQALLKIFPPLIDEKLLIRHSSKICCIRGFVLHQRRFCQLLYFPRSRDLFAIREPADFTVPVT